MIKKYLLLLIILTPLAIHSQVVFEELNSDIYNFLQRTAQKGIIEFNDYVKPASRDYISELLQKVQNDIHSLTNLEKKELDYYLAEYGDELDRDSVDHKGNYNFFSYDKHKVWQIFSYKNDNMYLNVSPRFSYLKGKWSEESYNFTKLGLDLKGNFGKILGFNFKLQHHRQEPGNVNDFFLFIFNKNNGADVQLRDAERVEFSFVDASIGTNWSWGALSMGKGNNTIGYERNGNIIFSDKSLSQLFIRFDATPTSWLKFNFMHVWLNSDLYDSSAFYPTFRYRRWGSTDRTVYIQKYMALHNFTFTPYAGLDISIGESVIYAYDFKPEYFSAIIPFGLLGEYWDDESDSKYNSQWFISLSSRNHIKNTHLYGSFYADELSVSNSLDSSIEASKYAYSLGASVVDLPINNLTLNIEYTKILPSTYQHFEPTLTSESSGFLNTYRYTLGHWAGDNSEILYGAINYRILRGLDFTLWGQYIKKGSEIRGIDGYTSPEKDFLYADPIKDRKNYTFLGFKARYELFHNIKIQMDYNKINIETKQVDESFASEDLDHLTFSLSYGIN